MAFLKRNKNKNAAQDPETAQNDAVAQTNQILSADNEDAATEPQNNTAETTNEAVEPTDNITEPADEKADETDNTADTTKNAAENADDTNDENDKEVDKSDETANETNDAVNTNDETPKSDETVATANDTAEESNDASAPANGATDNETKKSDDTVVVAENTADETDDTSLSSNSEKDGVQPAAKTTPDALSAESAILLSKPRKLHYILLVITILSCLLLCGYVCVQEYILDKPIRVANRYTIQEQFFGLEKDYTLRFPWHAANRDTIHKTFVDLEKRYRVILQAPMIYQNPELPNGCEAVSMTMALQYAGFPVTKTEFAADWLTCVRYWGGNPNEAYLGNPFGTGYYCYAPPLVDAANRYLTTQNSRFIAKDITGADVDTVLDYITVGTPVVVWVTLAYNKPYKAASFAWTMSDGARHYPYQNLHCVLVTGYDKQNVYINDPLRGEISVSMEKFTNVYLAMEQRAAIVQKR